MALGCAGFINSSFIADYILRLNPDLLSRDLSLALMEGNTQKQSHLDPGSRREL